MTSADLPTDPDEPRPEGKEPPPGTVERTTDADGNAVIRVGSITITTVTQIGRTIRLGVPAPGPNPEQN